ncbi:MFS transporter [Paludisphaera mucosa]|uniref:MFS transporter n=1 Tax=Paludisphaera mucosa TaxID=3030827 RepID=A0ABT6FCW2_9BACT|nr:MFS transporter [Paludisphaera mucosa]MDG3005422.1 MFS transporter [Paludisphaera mucosa]
MSQVVAREPTTTVSVERQRVFAALAVVPILATVYQTIVLTDVTADVIRKGIEADSYQMIWTNLAWALATLYGIFLGMWGMARFGQRLSLCVGLVLFALGNLLCGSAIDVATMSGAKVVEGIGKGVTIVLCRSILYHQFDRALLVAVGFYGVGAYSTRNVTPLVTAYVNDWLSWRWIFWINVPIAALAIPMVLRFIRPDRAAVPRSLRIDWVGVTLFAAWVSCLLFAFGWYRKWGGWTSNEFAVTATLCLLLPIATVAWVGSGLSADEHLRRILRVRTYVLAMGVRGLLLLNISAVLAVLSKYMTELRDYPREVAGWVLAPASLMMAASTLLTTYFHRRNMRHIWLLAGVLGSAGCVWCLSSIDNFTPKGHIATILAFWGLFLGLLPPVFLTDEVESLEPKDALYAGGLAIVCIITMLLIIPVATSTTISAWSDRALDSQRLNLRGDRVVVREAQARLADEYRRRGLAGPDQAALIGTTLAAFAKTESVARGIQDGLKFLSLVMLGLGLTLASLRCISPPRQNLIPDPQHRVA